MTTAKERTGRGALPKSIEVVEAGPSVGWQGGPCADRPRGLEQIRVGWNRRRRSTAPVNLLCLFEVDRIVVGLIRGAVPTDNHIIYETGNASSMDIVCQNVVIGVFAHR